MGEFKVYIRMGGRGRGGTGGPNIILGYFSPKHGTLVMWWSSFVLIQH